MSARKSSGWAPYGLVAPSLLFLGVFFAWPMYRAVELTFTKADEPGLTLDTINRATAEASFGEAWRNTLLIIAILIPLQFALALAMALLVNGRLRGRGVLVYIFAIPIAISDLAAGIVWFSIFTENGYLNTVLVEAGLLDRPFVFLNITTSWPLAIIILAELWRATSLVFVILLAGLQGIPAEYDEAAAVFGAGWFTRLRKVTLPVLRPSILVALILRTILAFQMFAVVVALTGGSTRVLAAESFRWFNRLRDEHVASAYASFILLLSLIVVVIYLRVFRDAEEKASA
ncbi:MAG: sugar ABC transporter permease [Acidimicrobiia bacterium]|nr:sugar ABC transporter permease [Acidimicrobiia bacterium]